MGNRVGLRLDLDTVLRDTGYGRRYRARSLDIALIQQTIEQFISHPAHHSIAHQKILSSQSALLIGPVDELIQRLLDGEAPGLLEQWVASWREHARSKNLPRLVILVSSLHACRLRRIGLESVAEITIHRLLLDFFSIDFSGQSTLRAELISFICKETDLTELQAYHAIQQLGIDLRLIHRWLQWQQNTTGNQRKSLDAFLIQEPAKSLLLQAELGSLEGIDPAL